MENRLSQLIEKSDLTHYEFGLEMWPELKDSNRATIQRRVVRLCKKAAPKLEIGEISKIQKILNCSYNEVVYYEI